MSTLLGSKPIRQSELIECLTTLSPLATAVGAPPAPHRTVAGGHEATGETRPEASPDSTRALLVVEDNVVNQRVAVHMLQRLGYRGDVAANGREALEALTRIPYAAVLMDCQMPDMDGFEATAAIRQRESTDRHTTIIAMTANALQGERERCLEAGMDDYISKPVQIEALREVLGRWVGRDSRPASAA